MPLSSIPHITVSSRDYAKVEALYIMLLRRVHHAPTLTPREKTFYMDKLGVALSSTRLNEQKLANLEAIQHELDGRQS